MAKEPTIGEFIDDEERELYEAIESDDYQPGENYLTPELKSELQEIARNTISDDRTKITLRVSNTDLSRLKAQAMREGMPYQTLINSILHKAVS